MYACMHMPKARQTYVHADTVHSAKTTPHLGSFRPFLCEKILTYGTKNLALEALPMQPVASCFPSHHQEVQ